jgi:hypothetical protein
MSDDERPCMHRWYASRPEVETLPVLHVCVEDWHAHPYGLAAQPVEDTGITMYAVPVHRCSCGATVVGDGATAPDDPAAAVEAARRRWRDAEGYPGGGATGC